MKSEPTFDVAAARTGLDPLWGEIEWVAETGSTNDDLVAAVADPATAAEGLVRIAELQTAGRGRLDRTWVAPAGSALTFSFVLRPTTPSATWGWIPMLAGLGVHDALRSADLDAHLKWPNDVQLGEQLCKAAGILVQLASSAAVVGIGVNIDRHDGLLPTAAALRDHWDARREDILRSLLNAIAARYRQWSSAGGDAQRSGIRDAYRRACVSIGQRVRVELPGSSHDAFGDVTDIDEQGRLVLRHDDGTALIVGAGDVTHVRKVD